MGKATRWLKGLLGMKKEKDHCDKSGSLAQGKKEKKGSGEDEQSHITFRAYVAEKEDEQNKHTIAVRSLSHGRGTFFRVSRERWAALKIQTLFRGYLARKALRALKALVKIQALVRGYLVRKRVAATLHSMQALMRAQSTVRSQRARRSINKENTFPRKYVQLFDETRNESQSKGLPTSYDTSLNGFVQSPKVVMIDTQSHRTCSRSRCITTTNTMSECGEDLHYQAISSSPSLTYQVPGRISVHECQHPQDFEWYFNVDERKFSTAQNTPRLANCGDTFFQNYSNFPSYMANTQSSKAKLRSHSAPKQRPEPKKRFPLNEIMATRNSISGVRMQWSSNSQTRDYSCFDRV
ncbi:P-loop containing nucleoside triphosphate hydrolase [Sesbania bispinosa]|nr:P-loop containing nucleoside triphosphate hydrolase [Sesbania bispinosa]